MPIKGKYFPSQKPREKVFLLLRRHWFTYAGFIFITLIMAIPLVIFLVYFSFNNSAFEGIAGNILVVLAPTYALGILALNLYGFVDYYLDIYIVTNERIVNILQNGFFKRDVSELHLHQVQDVNASVKGFFPTMFHYGDILIQTAGEKENFVFKSIPHPYRVSRKIIDLLEEALERKEAEKLSDEESSIMDESLIKLPQEAKVIENVTGINPETFKLARSRTKDFLAGNELEPVEKDDSNILSEVSREESDQILNLVDKDEVKYIHKDEENGKILERIDNTLHKNIESKKIDSENKQQDQKIEESVETMESGELKENKEIDLKDE